MNVEYYENYFFYMNDKLKKRYYFISYVAFLYKNNLFELVWKNTNFKTKKDLLLELLDIIESRNVTLHFVPLDSMFFYLVSNEGADFWWRAHSAWLTQISKYNDFLTLKNC